MTRFPDAQPSSIQFVESNILVGRKNNTIYEIVQITQDHAVLSTIEFTGGPGSVEYTHSIYDSAQSILWVSVFSKKALYGFRYALKGVSPMKDASARSGSIIAFDQVAEYPLDAITSMALRPKSGPDDSDNPSIIYASPSGISMVKASNGASDIYGPAPAPPPPAPASVARSTPEQTQVPTPKKAAPTPKAAPPPKPKAVTNNGPTNKVNQVDEKPDISKLAAVSTPAPAPAESTETPKTGGASSAGPEMQTLLKQVSGLPMSCTCHQADRIRPRIG